jgi:DNA-binding MarR family transcriptional regulator
LKLTVYYGLIDMKSSSLASFHEGLETVLAHIVQDFMRFMKQHGLSTPQIHALMYIYHAGECQVSDIGALADVSNAAASQLVERLVQQGLVERQEDPTNRRTKILRLSKKGKGWIRDSVSSNHFLMEVMAFLTTDQRKTVQAAFIILAQTAGRMQVSQKRNDGNHA